MEFGCCQIFCGGGDWALLRKFIASHYELHSVGFGILGSDVAYYAAVCDLTYFGYLMLVNLKNVLVPSISRIPWKRHPISFANAILHFFFQTPLLGACTIGVFLSLGILPRSSGLD